MFELAVFLSDGSEGKGNAHAPVVWPRRTSATSRGRAAPAAEPKGTFAGTMTTQEELPRQRLDLLQLAEALGNVNEACRRRGVSRTQFYEYRRRFRAGGLEGLKDLPPIPKSHPLATPPEVEERIIAFSSEQPRWGCIRLSNRLKREGTSISSPMVQRILIKHGLGTRYHRWLKLREWQASEAIELTEEQAAFMEKQGRAFGERRVQGYGPAEFYVRLREGKIVLEPVTRSPIDALCGKYSDVDFLAHLETEHRREARDEAALRAWAVLAVGSRCAMPPPARTALPPQLPRRLEEPWSLATS